MLHTFRFWDELWTRAEVNEHGVTLFEGHTTKVFHYLGISTSWRSRIIRTLEDVGSIQIIQRGTAHQPSIIVLRGEPSEERIYESDLTRPEHLATMVARLEERVRVLEGWRAANLGLDIAQAMANHESRLSHLEGLEQERDNAKTTQSTNRNKQTKQGKDVQNAP